MHSCFVPATILLPREDIPVSQWGCLACDQFTSQPEYWADAEALAAEKPSALHMVLPEVYLDQPDLQQRIQTIHATMEEYRTSVLTRQVKGFVYVERTLEDGSIRQGLVGAVDLEDYDYTPGAKPLVRPTENTVVERIPPRMAVRQDASLESPHILMLVDDRKNTLVEQAAAAKDSLPLLYQGQLPLGSGMIRGWAVEDPALVEKLTAAMADLGSQASFDERYPDFAGQPPMAMVVGDGNHSLATAKACWEKIKAQLPAEQWENHPARYCLAEVCNVHSPAIVFEPVHRVVFGTAGPEMLLGAAEYCDQEGIVMDKNRPQYSIRIITHSKRLVMGLRRCKEPLAVAVVQKFLDRFIAGHQECTVDYIHGEDEVARLVQQHGRGTIGLLLPEFPKEQLFCGVVEGGVLPRKTFSMGKAREKRCYLECRSLLP